MTIVPQRVKVILQRMQKRVTPSIKGPIFTFMRGSSIRGVNAGSEKQIKWRQSSLKSSTF